MAEPKERIDVDASVKTGISGQHKQLCGWKQK